MKWVCATILASSFILNGCPSPKPKPKFTEPPLGSDVPAYSTYRECKRTSFSYRDSKKAGYELKIGSGFSDNPRDLEVFRAAARMWAKKTSLPITVSVGHRLKGMVHIHDKLSLCGDARERMDENWKFASPETWNEYVYGCYVSSSDEITLSRAALMKLAENLASDAGSDAEPAPKIYDKLLFWTSMHEIGHWLGVALERHPEKFSSSVMAAGGPMQSVMGEGKFNRVWVFDRRLACLRNDCGEDWCSRIKEN